MSARAAWLDPAEDEHAERLAIEVAREAGGRALQAFQTAPRLEFKGRQQDDPVTAADRELETFLRAELRARFPAHGIIGEEHADDLAPSASSVWVLDPLDGTANFAAGLPLWGVSLALLRDGRPVVGCVWVPVGPSLRPGVFHARAGGGAWFDEQPLRVPSGEDPRGRLITLPGQHWRAFRFRRPPRGTPPHHRGGAEPRALGSITAELALVASGVLRLAIFVQPRVWDVAAGALLVQEAGGCALAWSDRRWQPLERFEPVPPEGGRQPSALRHWSQPVIAGPAGFAWQAAGRLAWQPRLPRQLRRLLGLAD